LVTYDDIVQARARIDGHVLQSPCAYSESLSKRFEATCYLKLENLQRTGSFKERGACNTLMQMTPEERSRGIVCSSAGNHAQGVAYHATRLGIDATIVMPERSPLVKVQNTRALGGRVVLHGASYDEAYEEASRLCQLENRVFVHPFDADSIIAGQGTMALEILEQVPDLDVVLVAVGGGGLISGVATVIKHVKPQVRVIGVQTRAFSGMKAALAHGSPITLAGGVTLAEGIAVRRVGERTLAATKAYVDEIVLVDEEEIAEAILVLLEREKTVAEGAGAAPIAALLQGLVQVKGKKCVSIICGGNIDVTLMSRIIERGLVKSGRLVRFAVQVPDVAGSLAKLTHVVAQTKANIVEIHHERAFSPAALSHVLVELVLETRGFDHIDEVNVALEGSGYHVARRS
jgi:threonine dehydratase